MGNMNDDMLNMYLFAEDNGASVRNDISNVRQQIQEWANKNDVELSESDLDALMEGGYSEAEIAAEYERWLESSDQEVDMNDMYNQYVLLNENLDQQEEPDEEQFGSL